MTMFKKYKFWIIAFVFFLVLRIPSLFEPYWYGDEGIYLALGEGIRKNLTLYTQIHDNKPPLLYYLAAVSQTVFGFRLLLLLVMIPTVLSFYKLCQLFFNEKVTRFLLVLFIFITSIPMIEGNIANAEIFMLLPTIYGIYLIYKNKRSFDLLLGSLLMGIAFTIKVPVAVEFVFICFWFLLTNINNFDLKKIISKYFLMFFGFVLPIILFGIYFYFHHAIFQFIFASVLQNFGYLSSWSTGTHTSSATQGGILNRLIILVIFYLAIGILFILKKINKDFAFISLWFAATIFGSLLSTRPYPHYLIQIVPPVIMLIGLMLSKTKILNKFLVVLLLIFLLFVVKKYKFYFYNSTLYYKNFIQYITHNIDKEKYYSYFGWEVNNIHRISKYINENTSSTDKIFVWGDSAFIYALSDRLPVGRYTVAYHIMDFNGFPDTIERLKVSPPKYIIYYKMTGRTFIELDKFIDKYYYPEQSFDSTILYKFRN